MKKDTDTPETDSEADDAHNVCLDYDCQGKDDNIQTPIVVPADFARKLERERNEAYELIREMIELNETTGDPDSSITNRARAILPENR